MQKIWIQSLGWDNPLEKGMVTPPVFLPGEFHGQRSLAGYSPWGCKELDTTEVTTPVFFPGESHGQRSLAGSGAKAEAPEGNQGESFLTPSPVGGLFSQGYCEPIFRKRSVIYSVVRPGLPTALGFWFPWSVRCKQARVQWKPASLLERSGVSRSYSKSN